MGSLHAREFADAAKSGEVNLEQAMIYHLTANHYPPISARWAPVVVSFIEATRRGEQPAFVESIYLGKPAIPAADFIAGLHLGEFLAEDDPDEA